MVEIRSHKVRGGIPLIRLRNPHGNSKEWTGDWSDGDRNWNMIPEHKRRELGLTFDDDGEFYMSFRDLGAHMNLTSNANGATKLRCLGELGTRIGNPSYVVVSIFKVNDEGMTKE